MNKLGLFEIWVKDGGSYYVTAEGVYQADDLIIFFNGSWIDGTHTIIAMVPLSNVSIIKRDCEPVQELLK